MSLDFYLRANRRVDVCDLNITHNLGPMAKAAGIYDCLWRPAEHGYTHAAQIVPILERGLRELRGDPEKFKAYNASNGWGMYENFVPFVAKVLEKCQENPDGEIYACT